MGAIKSLISFYLLPYRENTNSTSTGKKALNTLILLLFNWFLLILFGVLINGLLVHYRLIPEIRPNPRIFQSLALSLFSLAFIGPIIEELVSRIWLIYTRRNLAIAIGTIAGTLIYKFYLYAGPHQIHQNIKNTFIAMFLGGIFGYLAFILIRKEPPKYKALFNRHLKKMTILSSVIFGYLHLFNYKLSFNVLIFSPVILINYIIAGLILSFIRIRYGLIYCIMFHMIYNAALILIKYR